MVCPPALRRRCIGGLCSCCIACAGIWQINGNATVNPCKRFWRFGRNCMDDRKAAVNACKRLTRRLAKRKALHRVDARQKKKTAGFRRGRNYLFFSSRFARAAQSSCVSSSVKSYSVRSWSASALLHPPSYRAAALLKTSFNMIFSSFLGFFPFCSMSYCRGYSFYLSLSANSFMILSCT